jgi:Holliday junction resolvase RusA-like endonuclease
MIQIVIPGDPVAKASPRAFVNPRTGRPIITNATKTQQAMNYLCAVAKDQVPEDSIEDPVSLRLDCFFAVPKSKPKWWKEAAVRGDIPHSKKPDADNLSKLLCDCLTRLGVLADDSQVAELHVRKRYSSSPRTEITIRTLTTYRSQKAWKTRTR